MSLTTMTLGRGRRVAAASLIAVAALTLTACQDGTGSASRPSSAAAPATSHGNAQGDTPSSGAKEPTGAKEQPSASGEGPSATAASSASAGGEATGTPNATESDASSMTASDRCTAADMSLRLGPSDIGAGNIRYPLVFTNKGTEACTLSGFPGVSLIKRDGSAVGKPASREGGAGGVVRLQPGQSAHAVLHTLNEGISDTPCWADSQLVFVYPPGSKEPMTTGSRGLRVCGGRFDVTTVEAGEMP
ncbi:DUF4232 domain-containing protein [Streptomyces sp. NPDC048506]|uniref:DUF4232 domain-containing protein n=1 Tax=Streptomyces sp. NPDC048506 TaxID=3155028 RepID=UPI003444AED9